MPIDKIHLIETQQFKLDGGAMFGVVPKQLWQRFCVADANNLVDMAARSWLIERGVQKILIDTGIGDKQSEKFFGYYHLWGEHTLMKSLESKGFAPEDITDVFFTHLHFDHCGGAVIKESDGTLHLAFPKARYWIAEHHLKWALNPNDRERASFLKENIQPIVRSDQLITIPTESTPYQWIESLGFEVLWADGHTEKQMIPNIEYQGFKMVFAADLLPTVAHIPMPYVMSYDVRPLETLKEKALFLSKAADERQLIFLQHDAQQNLCRVRHTDKGVRLDEVLDFEGVFKTTETT